MNESIKSFNEGEAKKEEEEEKMDREVFVTGGGSGSAYLSEGRILI